jgi:phospholipase A1
MVLWSSSLASRALVPRHISARLGSIRRVAVAGAVAFATFAGSAGAAATTPADDLRAGVEACARLRDDTARLACYDSLSVAQPAAAAGTPAAAVATPGSAAARKPGTTRRTDDDSFLDEYWELSADRKSGTFNFTGYRPNYFFPVHVTNHINRTPTSPAANHTGTLPEYRDLEAKLQVSIRTKLVEGLVLPNADLWFAYTQQSLWQLYSAGISRPFRSTDHEPELIYIAPLHADLPLGWKLKLAGLGLAHQSNGQTLPLSRSWNRWYALGGIEKDQLAVTARHNARIHESDGQDDNPDLTDYRGRSELLAIWSPGSHTVSALWKTNFNSRRGSLQFDWTLPVNRKHPNGLRWYAQVFTGYGETLIDYNFRQTSIGAGITLFAW